jgi:hypothetical protein
MGGSYPSFNGSGKVWSKKGPLHNHIKLVTYHDKYHAQPVYIDCEIIEYEINEAHITNAMDYIREHKLHRPED